MIKVTLEATTLIFSHANFTVRETILAPKQVPEGAGALVLYQIKAIRPMTLTFSFTPVMQRMWPALSDDRPSPEWVKTAGVSGFYVLHLNFPDHAAAIAMPTAEPGILEPYQERAHNYPLQFVLHFDPARQAHTYFPLLFTLGSTGQTAATPALASRLAALEQDFPSLYRENSKYYRNFRASHMSIETPDETLKWFAADTSRRRGSRLLAAPLKRAWRRVFKRRASNPPAGSIEAGIEECLPEPGSETAQMKVLDQQSTANSLTLRLAAPAGSSQTIFLRINSAKLRKSNSILRATGIEIPDKTAALQKLQVEFPADAAAEDAYVEKEISFTGSGTIRNKIPFDKC